MDKAGRPWTPSFRLDLSELPIAHRFDAWCQAFGGQYEMTDLPRDLDAQGRVYDLGKAVLVDTIHPGLGFVRDTRRARRDGADNILISTELSGSFHVESATGEDRIGAGAITLFDVARPVIKRASAGRTLVLSVSRDLIEEAMPGRDLHALTLGGAGALMAEHLRNLYANLPAIAPAAAPLLVRATVQMLAACVLPTADRLEQARPALTGALLARTRRYIRAQCHDRALTPDRVAAAVGASRSSLYRAFEPFGGVADYIRRSRLDAARRALADPADMRRIGEIAFALGFSSEAQFSRAMRAAFGAAPSDLRRELTGTGAGGGPETWLRRGWDADVPAAGAVHEASNP